MASIPIQQRHLKAPWRSAPIHARMKNPAMILPDTIQAIQALQAATKTGGVPAATLGLVHLRASQINGCCVYVVSGTRHAKTAGETDERLFAVAAWQEAPYFTEAVTRLSDRADPVPDAIWEEAARHYDEPALATLILAIATTNVFNYLNVTTRQVAGAWG